MKRIVAAVLFMVTCGANAAVVTNSDESAFANYMFNGCTAQRENISLNRAMKMINPEGNETVARTVRSGYTFGSEFPWVGCNQIFVTVIDEMVSK